VRSLLKLPLLQAEQMYFVQSLFVHYVLQAPDHPLTSPLNSLQLVNTFLVLGNPRLDAGMSLVTSCH